MNPIVFTDEYRKLNKQMMNDFGDGIPCMEMPSYETLDGLKEKISLCYKHGENTLWEMYGLDKLMDTGAII